jgi:outer membrane protein OmpA-like peptidoglycan-associated protein
MIIIILFLFQSYCFGQTPYYANFDKEQKIKLFNETNPLGQAINDFTIITKDGTIIRTEKLIGKVVVLNFFFTPCNPCEDQILYFNKLVKKYLNPNILFLGVSIKNTFEELDVYQDELRKKLGEEWLFDLCPAYDYENLENKSFKSSNRSIANNIIMTNAFPTTIIIDKEGLIRYRQQGYDIDYSQNIENVLDSIIQEKYKNTNIETIDLPINIIDSSFRNQKLYVMKHLFFKSNSMEITTNATNELQLLIEFLLSNNTINIEIIAHTDDIGDEKHNLELSYKRAKNVADYLILHEITEDRIVLRGKGEKEPIVTNDTEINRAKNRRIEIKIIE